MSKSKNDDKKQNLKKGRRCSLPKNANANNSIKNTDNNTKVAETENKKFNTSDSVKKGDYNTKTIDI